MWRRGGLVVSALDFRSGGRWFEPGLCHPGRSSNIPSRFMLRKPESSSGLMGHLARKQTLPLPASVVELY